MMYNHLGSWKHKFVQERSSDQFFYNNSIMWSWFALIVMLYNTDNLMIWRLLETMFQYSFTNWSPSILNLILIMKFQVTYSPIFLHNDSFGSTFFVCHKHQVSDYHSKKTFYKESNLETFELALTFYEHVDLQIIPWKD